MALSHPLRIRHSHYQGLDIRAGRDGGGGGIKPCVRRSGGGSVCGLHKARKKKVWGGGMAAGGGGRAVLRLMYGVATLRGRCHRIKEQKGGVYVKPD